MASTFAERINRIEANDGVIKLFAGNGKPQNYAPSSLSGSIVSSKSLEYGAISAGVLVGIMAGYIFKRYAGINLFLDSSLIRIFELTKEDMMMAGGIASVAIGFMAFVSTLIINRKRARLLQF